MPMEAKGMFGLPQNIPLDFSFYPAQFFIFMDILFTLIQNI